MKKQKEMNHVEEGERSGRINLSCPYFDPTVNDDLAVRINVVFRTVPPISKYKIKSKKITRARFCLTSAN